MRSGGRELRPLGGGGRTAWLVSVRTAWRAVDDGEFYCAHCGGDRNYRGLTGRRRLTVLGVPLLSRGTAAPVVECADCQRAFPPAALAAPTTRRLAVLLRDGVHTIALALLAAGGSQAPAARAAAVRSVGAAGFPECTEERLLTLLDALGGEGEAGVAAELRAALGALAPHLARPGRERLLLGGARVALADGPYTAAEREALAAVGGALGLGAAETERLLAAAAPS